MFSEMDEKKLSDIKFRKMQFILLSIPLNHSITVVETFRLLTSRCYTSAWMTFFNLILLNLIRRQGKLA